MRKSLVSASCSVVFGGGGSWYAVKAKTRGSDNEHVRLQGEHARGFDMELMMWSIVGVRS